MNNPSITKQDNMMDISRENQYANEEKTVILDPFPSLIGILWLGSFTPMVVRFTEFQGTNKLKCRIAFRLILPLHCIQFRPLFYEILGISPFQYCLKGTNGMERLIQNGTFF